MKLSLFLLLILNLNQHGHARIRDYQTTQMIATAGAGIGSIDTINALYANPASSGYKPQTLFYGQTNNASMSDSSSQRASNDHLFNAPAGQSFALIDGNRSSLRGGLGYTQYREGHISRRRYTFSSSALSTGNFSMGFNYYYTSDSSTHPGYEYRRSFHQVNYGLTYLISPSFTFGLVYQDVFKAQSHLQRMLMGTELILNPTVSLLFDWGVNPHRSQSTSRFMAAAIKLNFHGNFSIKAGLQQDRLWNSQSLAWGLSWRIAQLTLDFAMNQMQSHHLETNPIIYPNEKLREVSLALSYRF